MLKSRRCSNRQMVEWWSKQNCRMHHWRRLVKNIGWANQNIGGQKVVKSDKCMGVSQLLGGTCPGCPPKSVLSSPHAARRLISFGPPVLAKFVRNLCKNQVKDKT